jgi:4-hydroxy-tetrahydrodipicolinate synthase
MCGGANMVPRLYVDVFEAARAGDVGRLRTLHQRVVAISDAIYSVGCPESSYFRGLKCALECLGLCRATLAEPYEAFGPAERDEVRQRLRQLDLLSD